MKAGSQLIALLLTAIMFCGVVACNEDEDTSIKADLTAKAMVERDFQGVYFTVDKATVTLNGECPTQKAKDAVETKVKGTFRVKGIINNIAIAPVTIGTDDLLRHSVDSTMQYYAGAAAITKDSVIYLKGKVESNKVQQLTDALNSFKPKGLESNLSIK